MKREPRDVVLLLARELAAQVLLNYAPEEMAENTRSLTVLYMAQQEVQLPSDVTQVIDLIEADIARYDHHQCINCDALFFDTEDLNFGQCPICNSEVKGVDATISV